MNKSIWNQCTRKKRYRDEHTANHYRKAFERLRGKKLDYYWCVYCHGYHLTSKEGNLEEKCLTVPTEDKIIMEYWLRSFVNRRPKENKSRLGQR